MKLGDSAYHALWQLLAHTREQTPVVHCITNYVTVNDVANMILACGGSPIMADDEAEAAAITSLSTALLINIGTLNTRTIASMIKAGKKANALGHPVILDPVGAGASPLRTQSVMRLIEQVRFTVIKGNISEIKCIAGVAFTAQGVDAAPSDADDMSHLPQTLDFIKAFSRKSGALIAVTGKVDLLTDGCQTALVRNGTAMMSKITGAGCMLGGVIGALCGANPAHPFDAALAGIAAHGLCGETAYRRVQAAGGGTSSFRTAFIDAMSLLEEKTWKEGARIETL